LVQLMALHWIICGSARGVGKTHLSSRLVGVLPRAIYAKLGHCQPKPNGRPGYFCSEESMQAFLAAQADSAFHFIIESHAWSRAGRGDVVIFLCKQVAGLPLRDDLAELRERAHISLGAGESSREWAPILAQHLASRNLTETVVGLLTEQDRYLNARGEKGPA
jgi:hypothetical protein